MCDVCQRLRYEQWHYLGQKRITGLFFRLEITSPQHSWRLVNTTKLRRLLKNWFLFRLPARIGHNNHWIFQLNIPRKDQFLASTNMCKKFAFIFLFLESITWHSWTNWMCCNPTTCVHENCSFILYFLNKLQFTVDSVHFYVKYHHFYL